MMTRRTARILITACIFALAAPSLRAEDGKGVQAANFHHVHLNVKSVKSSIRYYKKFFGALDIKYHDSTDGLFTERSFILFNEVAEAPRHGPRTAISHIGWATTDGPATYEWLKEQGAEFQTHIDSLGRDYGMYIYGPDRELIEVWTGSRNHRFDHVHLWATDAEKTVAFFREQLGLNGRVGPKPRLRDRENLMSLRMSFIRVDNVNLVVFEKPDFESVWWPGSNYTAEDAPEDFEPTKGHVIDHLGFSYRDIDPVFERMKAAGVEIAEPIAEREGGHRSFFVLAPDKMLIEIVEARPIPEASWD